MISVFFVFSSELVQIQQAKPTVPKSLPSYRVREAVGGAPADVLLFVLSLLRCCTERLLTVKARLASQTPRPPKGKESFW